VRVKFLFHSTLKLIRPSNFLFNWN
jgi:hypothetical protein